jgi:hypothetical protein
MQNEYLKIREQQLKEQRVQQEILSGITYKANNSNAIENVNTLKLKASKLLNETTAINVSSLNLGNGSNVKQIIDNELDYKLGELYQVLKQIREVHKFTGKIIS